MKLLFDLNATQPLGKAKRHGGGKYGEIIFFRLVETGIEFSCFYDSRKWLNPDVKQVVYANHISLFDIAKKGLTAIIRENKFDRIYSSLPKGVRNIRNCEVYGTIHGLRRVETPRDSFIHKYKGTFKEYLKIKTLDVMGSALYFRDTIAPLMADNFHINTVSEHSKNSMYAYYSQMKDNDIKVFYSPNTSSKTLVARNENAEKYFLQVSGNRWEKNTLRGVIAFDRLASSGLVEDIRMKVTGTDGTIYKYKLQNPDKFDFLGYVREEELEHLYADAYCFLYPSLNEGFGYPPMEAMRYGIPVISSPFSAIAEVCGSGALYFNPFSVEEIMNRMLMMLEPKWHEEYAKKGYEQYKRIKKLQDEDLDKMIKYITE